MASGGEKTEEATPKKKEEARNKGQVARSQDLNGALVMVVGLWVIGMTGPGVVARMGDVMTQSLNQISDPDVVSREGVGSILLGIGQTSLMALAPIALACMLAGVVASVGQVGFKPATQALKPQPSRLNPMSGFKNIFGPHAAVEGVKSVSKVSVVAAVTFAWLGPKVAGMGAMVGISPLELAVGISDDVRSIAMRAAMVYIVIGMADFAYQKHRTNKQLKMDKQEVKEESKGNELPPEVRGAMRRRQMQAARARMMQDVPTADVVVTNPTHFAVALRYDGSKGAPEVVAKGQDLLAQKIKGIAKDAGVPIVEDKPLARGLFAACEVGHEIPEELFAAVAQVLAFVYRLKARTS